MCQSRADGGQRCGCDSSQSRNHRRIKSKISSANLLGRDENALQHSYIEPAENKSIVDDNYSAADYRKALIEAGVPVGKQGRLSSEDIAHAQKLLDRKISETRKPTESLLSSLKDEAEEVSALFSNPRYSDVSVEMAVTRFGEKVAAQADIIAGIDELQVKKEKEEYQANVSALKDKIKSKTKGYQLLQDSAYPSSEKLAEEAGVTRESPYFKRIMALTEDERNELFEKINESFEPIQDCLQEIKELDLDQYEKASARHQKRADAYRQVLVKIRPFGGKVTNIDSKSDKKSVALLNTALKDIPSSWIERSNNNNNVTVTAPSGVFIKKDLMVTESSGRAHYSQAKLVITKKRVLDGVVRDLNYYASSEESLKNQTFDSDSKEYVRISDLSEQEGKEYGIEKNSDLDVHNYYLVKQFDVAHVTMHGELVDKPRGKGWEKVRSKRSNATDKDMVWRRPRTKLISQESYVSEITVSKDTSPLSEPGVSVAAHEFTHRVEDSYENFGKIEQQFMVRRTSNPYGKRDELEVYGQLGSGEDIRPDSFADVYMGKQYPTSRAHEIMTCGVQAVFHGDFGGFVGESKYKKDLDSRNFVLGMLATA